MLREPVARAISFFSYQKVRLRFPTDLSFDDYLAAADQLTDDDFLDPANERYMAFRGGCYADFLAPWLDTFGRDRLRIVWFEDLVTDEATVLGDVATFLGIDPAAFPHDELSSENRTTGYKNARAQQFALAVNDRFERVFRRHPEMKRKVRALYYKVNGRPTDDDVSPSVRDELAARYREPNARLAASTRCGRDSARAVVVGRGAGRSDPDPRSRIRDRGRPPGRDRRVPARRRRPVARLGSSRNMARYAPPPMRPIIARIGQRRQPTVRRQQVHHQPGSPTEHAPTGPTPARGRGGTTAAAACVAARPT